MPKRLELPEIVQTATDIEDDLQQLEALSVSASKLRLNTEKNISRAARTLQSALQQQEQLAARLGTLGQAMLGLQQRQQVAIDTLGSRAKEIQAQFTQLAELMARFGELGKQAVEVTQMLQVLPQPFGASEAKLAPTEDLAAVEQRLATIADDARALAKSADAADLSEVAQEAAALGQRLESARTRLAQIAKAHLARAN